MMFSEVDFLFKTPPLGLAFFVSIGVGIFFSWLPTYLLGKWDETKEWTRSYLDRL
jgi:hypothetical protein